MGSHNDKLDCILLRYMFEAQQPLSTISKVHLKQVPTRYQVNATNLCSAKVSSCLSPKLYGKGKCILPECKVISISENMYLLHLLGRNYILLNRSLNGASFCLLSNYELWILRYV